MTVGKEGKMAEERQLKVGFKKEQKKKRKI